MRPRGARRGGVRATVAALVAGAMLAVATVAGGQGTAVDNAVARARALVEAGAGRAGRHVLDSLVQEAGVATPALGELLYWRGLLAESSSEAERDWRRLLLEVPMSPRAEDALLRLAQLEQMRGRPAASRPYLERLAREYRDPGSQARSLFWLAKAFFDENDRPRACGALEVVRREAPPNAVELRQQADDLRLRCRGVTAVAPVSAEAPVTALAAAAVPPAPPASPPAPVAASAATPPADSLRAASAATPPADSLRAASAATPPADSLRAAAERARRDSAARADAARDSATRLIAVRAAEARDSAARATSATAVPATAAPATAVPATAVPATAVPATAVPATAAPSSRPATARFSVQLAALNTLRQAQQFAERFRTQGIGDARVDGTTAPFRVRTGYYATRAQANARLAELKARGIDGFVAELTP